MDIGKCGSFLLREIKTFGESRFPENKNFRGIKTPGVSALSRTPKESRLPGEQKYRENRTHGNQKYQGIRASWESDFPGNQSELPGNLYY